MGKCRYCGQDAGILRKYHADCRRLHEKGVEQVRLLALSAISRSGNLDELDIKLRSVASDAYISKEQLKSLLVEVWEQAVEQALEDGLLTEEEENALVLFSDHFDLSQHELDRNGAFSKMVKSAIIREVAEGKIPQRVSVQGNLPFNLQKGETLVWVFTDVKYYERRTRREYKGGYHGVSIRVAKGVYYRVGGFRGNPVDVTETVHVDTGVLGITNRHLYFSGNTKSFRIPYRKIVSFVPYSDGLGVQRDAMTAKPQLFVTGDGWFIYNLVVNLAQNAG